MRSRLSLQSQLAQLSRDGTGKHLYLTMDDILQASGPSTTLEPHFGTHAAKAAAVQLIQWLNNQLGLLPGSSQAAPPNLQLLLDKLQQSMSVSTEPQLPYAAIAT